MFADFDNQKITKNHEEIYKVTTFVKDWAEILCLFVRLRIPLLPSVSITFLGVFLFCLLNRSVSMIFDYVSKYIFTVFEARRSFTQLVAGTAQHGTSP